MKNPKKETRDVIAKHVRWTEALRVVRAYHPEVTIILPLPSASFAMHSMQECGSGTDTLPSRV